MVEKNEKPSQFSNKSKKETENIRNQQDPDYPSVGGKDGLKNKK
jgi:hypothetical protein